MKKLATTLLLSATLLSSNVYAADDKVLATFKGGDVKESEVISQFQQALDNDPNFKGKKFSELDKNIQEALVKGFVHTKLIALEAKDSSIESSKAFQEKINKVKEQLMQQEVVEQYIQKHVTDSMIDAEYTKMAESLNGKDEFKASHILVETEAKAKEAKKKLSKGAKFADVVKEFSTDQATKASGGTLGYFTEGQLVPEFEKQVEKMKVGEISEPVKTQFGWHIIKLEDKRKVKMPSKDEAKQSIKQKLGRDVIEQLFQELSKKYDLKINL
jgi:peptidylprolyl isomerase